MILRRQWSNVSKTSATVTSAMLGLFRDNARTRQEFLSLVGSDHRD